MNVRKTADNIRKKTHRVLFKFLFMNLENLEVWWRW